MTGLKNLGDTLRALKGGRVDVGFFAGDASRTKKTPAAQSNSYDENLTNPEIAAKMEYGDPTPQTWVDRKGIVRHVSGIPPRSMLRSPLHLHGDKIVAMAKADAAAILSKISDIAPLRATKLLLTRVGIAAEALVQEAFATQGWGDWEPNSPETIDAKESAAPLIDTGQLRRAVTSRAVV